MGTLTLQQPHWEALTAEARKVFKLLSGLDLTQRFYLAGGTGLALHLGHRLSVDLDFFCEEIDAVNSNERARLREVLDDPRLEIVFDKDAAFVANWRAVGVSFFRLNLYPLVRPTFDVDGVRLASIEEIGAMQLAAVIDRGTRKDLIDLYYILLTASLDDLFQVAATKYAHVRTFAASAIRGLAYFEDAESLPMPQMIDKTPWAKMKKFLEKKALEAGRRRLGDLWT
ncbi:MAG TPA: nucleotidyl transferase AbiEii/AbiGii toxin family protein [Anaerolineales bacterium]|nr:nucleotidyl transferase AbiEii/AbiGii toxin family protein [Anaerolineales bacterium]